MDRREMIRKTGSVVAGLSLLGADAFAATQHNSFAASEPDSSESQLSGKKKKALIIGAHPDDPETACGGTMLLLAKAGYEVVSVYMTKGERGIAGKSLQEAADIRVPEAIRACEILGARPVFMTQIDGDTQINKER